MATSPQAKALLQSFKNAKIDSRRLLTDAREGSLDFTVERSGGYTLPDNREEQVLWALKKYGIDREYSLVTPAGVVVGKFDLVEGIGESEDVSYSRAIRIVQEMGGDLTLTELSQRVLDYASEESGYPSIGAVGEILESRGEESDIILAYWAAQGLDASMIDSQREAIIGEVDEERRLDFDASYGIAEDVFGSEFDNNWEGNRPRLAVHHHAQDNDSWLSIARGLGTDLEYKGIDPDKAVPVLMKLTEYIR